MLSEPLAGSPGRSCEIPHVSVKMPAGQHDEPLWFQRPLVSSQSFVCNSQMIAKRHHHHQWRRADVGDVRAGFVFQEHLDRAQRDLVPPSWCTGASGFGEPLPGVCGWQHGGPHGVFGDHWYHPRRLAVIARPAVLKARRLDLGDEIRADQPPRVHVPADQRHLSNDPLDPPVDGADHEHVGAAVT